MTVSQAGADACVRHLCFGSRLSPGQPLNANSALEVGELPENASLLSPATVKKMTSAGSATGLPTWAPNPHT